MQKFAQTYFSLASPAARPAARERPAGRTVRVVTSQRLSRLASGNVRRCAGQRAEPREVVLNRLERASEGAPVQKNNILQFLVQRSFTDYQQVQQSLFQILDEMQEELSKRLAQLHQRLNALADSNFVLMQGVARCGAENVNARVAALNDKVAFIQEALALEGE